MKWKWKLSLQYWNAFPSSIIITLIPHLVVKFLTSHISVKFGNERYKRDSISYFRVGVNNFVMKEDLLRGGIQRECVTSEFVTMALCNSYLVESIIHLPHDQIDFDSPDNQNMNPSNGLYRVRCGFLYLVNVLNNRPQTFIYFRNNKKLGNESEDKNKCNGINEEIIVTEGGDRMIKWNKFYNIILSSTPLKDNRKHGIEERWFFDGKPSRFLHYYLRGDEVSPDNYNLFCIKEEVIISLRDIITKDLINIINDMISIF